METVLPAVNWLLLLLYTASAVAYGVCFFRRHPGASSSATPLLRVTLAVHFLYLVGLTLRWQQLPAASVSQALGALAFAVAVVYALLEWQGRERSTGFWMVSLVVVFQVLSVVTARPEPPHRELFENPLFGIHVVLALLGYAAFAVAASYGFLFLRLYRELKRGRFSVFYGKLPSLEVLEKMMTGALIFGVGALTGAVIDGVIWAQRLGYDNWIHDPKIVCTLGIWLLYVVALVLKRLKRWQGRHTARVSLAGLGVIIFSLLAVNVLLTGFHEFL